jgi:hypothetical protein
MLNVNEDGQGGYRGPARFQKLAFPRWGDLVYSDE